MTKFDPDPHSPTRTGSSVGASSVQSSKHERLHLPVDSRDALRSALERRTSAGVLFAADDRALRCTACAHRCVLDEGRAGACAVRRNVQGVLRVPFGYVARKFVRSVESNVLHHVLPGAKALIFGMYGCDLRCPYCHNFRTSQSLREDVARAGEAPTDVTPEALVDEAIAAGCRVVCSAYNEPMITAEWAHAVFSEAKRRGLVTALVTNAHSTSEALAYLRPVTDVFRADLKGWSNDQYRALGGRLAPVLESIAEAKRLGYWIEVVTLVVPGFDDDREGLLSIADRIAAIDRTIPWHLDAFQPRYRMTDRPPPSATSLALLAGAAYARGLEFVYVGNVGDAFPELASTRCPRCSETLVKRRDWSTIECLLDGDRCRRCGTRVPGIFSV